MRQHRTLTIGLQLPEARAQGDSNQLAGFMHVCTVTDTYLSWQQAWHAKQLSAICCCCAVGSRQQQFRDHIKKWRASGLFKLAGAQAWRSRNFSRPDLKPGADPKPDALSSIQSALKEAESVMKHLDQAAEELFMQVRSNVGRGAWGFGCRVGASGGVWRSGWGVSGLVSRFKLGACRLECMGLLMGAGAWGSVWIGVHEGVYGLGCMRVLRGQGAWGECGLECMGLLRGYGALGCLRVGVHRGVCGLGDMRVLMS